MNKRNKIKLYAKALAEILARPSFAKASAGEEKKVIDNFVKLLLAARCESRSKEILDLAESLILIKRGNRKIIFETARKTTDGQKKILETFVKKGDIVKEKINPELIAGIKIIINDSQQFDASIQGKLQRIL